MSYFHCGNGYPDRCNGYRGPLDEYSCNSGRHKYDENGRQLPPHRTEAGYPRCATCDGGGCLDCTDPA